jgi:hypothetical protein
LFANFRRWVRDGVKPPPSTYPRIADGTLVTVAAHALAFPLVPRFTPPKPWDANRAAYEAKVRSAAADVVALGFLLPEDVDALVGEAGGLYDA